MEFDQPDLENKAAATKALPPADIKLTMLGDSAIGKSKLVERFLLNDYERYNSTTLSLFIVKM